MMSVEDRPTSIQWIILAAKAAGYELEEHYNSQGLYWPYCVQLEKHWCPLSSSEDALNLAVKLGLVIDTHGCYTRVSLPYCAALAVARHDDTDAFKATRLAITQAASIIGRAEEVHESNSQGQV